MNNSYKLYLKLTVSTLWQVVLLFISAGFSGFVMFILHNILENKTKLFMSDSTYILTLLVLCTYAAVGLFATAHTGAHLLKDVLQTNKDKGYTDVI